MTPEGKDSFAVNVKLLSKTAGPLLDKATINLDPCNQRKVSNNVTNKTNSTYCLGLSLIDFVLYL